MHPLAVVFLLIAVLCHLLVTRPDKNWFTAAFVLCALIVVAMTWQGYAIGRG